MWPGSWNVWNHVMGIEIHIIKHKKVFFKIFSELMKWNVIRAAWKETSQTGLHFCKTYLLFSSPFKSYASILSISTSIFFKCLMRSGVSQVWRHIERDTRHQFSRRTFGYPIYSVGNKAWNRWNYGTSDKPWNECRKTVELPREIRRLPYTIYTHPTANLVPGNLIMNMWDTLHCECAASDKW
jgi:hypothetical protein